ncbi:MAG: FHA domain-containing protein [Tannerella sp.]|jgi:hypothetical protein|nr:FHA domain-containing protein [Tannerella sp.]
MMKGFTKCPNGHYFKEELPYCPYCQGGEKATAETVKPQAKTEAYTKPGDEGKTRIVNPVAPGDASNRTVFGDEVKREIDGREVVQHVYRSSRKLVGWLVTYSFDPLGADFRLYEGRNEIGRDVACNITVPDKTVSGKHATILFREADGFAVQDNGSSAGTFLNDKSLGFSNDWHLLKDGDTLRMGETVFKFKTTV